MDFKLNKKALHYVVAYLCLNTYVAKPAASRHKRITLIMNKAIIKYTLYKNYKTQTELT